VGDRLVLDLKLQGTALLVDAARIIALAQGVEERGTRARLGLGGRRLGVPQDEVDGWIAAFDYLQMLRLNAQIDPAAHALGDNCIDLRQVNSVDRRILKVSLGAIKGLQQRLALDYLR